MRTAGWAADAAGYDPVRRPAHYEGAGCSCREALASMLGADAGEPGAAAYWRGCALKYLWRYRRKNGLEDLRKCRQCLDELIAAAEAEGGGR